MRKGRKVFNVTICYRADQIEFMEKNPNFDIHSFSRKKLDEYIKERKSIKCDN